MSWRTARAILALPFMATVVVPVAIVAVAGEPGGAPPAVVPLGGVLIAAGLAGFAWTVRLFATAGRGTLAPWDPPEALVVAGPYRHVRHPMITSVAAVLAGEALVLWLAGLAVWLAAFVAVNATYLPLVEEPRLVKRFGDEYRRYMEHVPRWIPRVGGWDPDPGT
jgi:protein-S-isoprenylcysteine O-methyltransferase Ste14